jgi:glycine dehydrogenase subunit 1
MAEDGTTQAHPYVPNSSPRTRAEMLAAVGVADIDDLYEAVPDRLRLSRPLRLPGPVKSEYELTRHIKRLLARNQTCEDNLSFLGGGCWQHYVPAVCDEVNRRAEFVTSYGGEVYSDHGKYQAFFEYASLLGELVDLEAVALSTYDWGSAASAALLMATRLTRRNAVLVAGTTGPERLAIIRNHCRPGVDVRTVGARPETLMLDLDELAGALSNDVAAVYFENPSYLGFIETQGDEVSRLAHEQGALCVVGVDPLSLGVLKPPPQYAADMVCGELQPLGIHMGFGGGLAGFIATPDTEEYVMENPLYMTGLAPTVVEGEYGFGHIRWDRTSFVGREQSTDFTGTATALWAITAGVYLALMGPQGMREIGAGIMQRSQYAANALDRLPGVTAPRFQAPHFKEFIVDFNGTARSVAEINASLADHGIFGGHDLGSEFPDLVGCALYCVTEVHTKGDIDRLVGAVEAATAP